MLFYGTWPSKIDSKGRMRIPPLREFRQVKIWFFVKKNGNICLYPEEKRWMIPAETYKKNIASKWRISIPRQLRNHLGSGKIAWVSQGSYVVIKGC